MEVQRMIANGEMAGALRVSEALIAQSQRSLPGWLGRGGALLNRGLLAEAALTPEANTHAVCALSHERVRKPMHRGTIGRWKNDEFAFDGSWDALVETHQEEHRAEQEEKLGEMREEKARVEQGEKQSRESPCIIIEFV